MSKHWEILLVLALLAIAFYLGTSIHGNPTPVFNQEKYDSLETELKATEIYAERMSARADSLYANLSAFKVKYDSLDSLSTKNKMHYEGIINHLGDLSDRQHESILSSRYPQPGVRLPVYRSGLADPDDQ